MDIILDFDGTITSHDTTANLAQSALDIQLSQGKDMSAQWKSIVQNYELDLKRRMQEYQPQPHMRTRVEEEFLYLRGLKDVDLRSQKRVNESGLFSGLDSDLLATAGSRAVREGKVRLRAGFEAFVDEMIKRGHKIKVISVNWSSAFIRGALSNQELDIFANEIAENGHISGPDSLLLGDSSPITTSGDKLRVLLSILPRQGDGMQRCVYIGDSTTDLECLLHCKGVVIAESVDTELLSALRRLSVEVPHVREANVKPSDICWARDFFDVLYSGISESFPTYNEL